jgi:ATP-dependent Lon protease
MSDHTIQTLPTLPVLRSVLYPGMLVPLTIGRDRSVAAVEAALQSDEKALVAVAQRQAEKEVPTQDDLFAIGTRGTIKQIVRGADGRLHALVQGVERVVLLKPEQTDPYLLMRVRPFPLAEERGLEIDALKRAIVEAVAELQTLAHEDSPREAADLIRYERDAAALAYRTVALLNLTVEAQQALLEAATVGDLLRETYGALSRELQVLRLRNKITNEAQAEIGKSQREYILRQQLKAIQQELGESDGQEDDTADLDKRIQEAGLPESVKKEADRELARLRKIQAASPEHQVIRAYLELLLELPWTKASPDSLDLARVRQVLDEDHYGIREVKDRIVEHLAVLKLNPQAKAPILCLVGPPGVGKTSLGQSVARALGRKFERISLGGVHDEAELRGHRRTYVGAMPGRIIQALRRAGVNNPVFMLDEVDKMGRDFRGDPSAALLEILDPAQNHTFRDNYVEVPFDLSKVMFITTANTLEPIAQPLLDRMEVIQVQGYSEMEKVEIALRYLWPRRLAEAGLTPEQVTLSREDLKDIIAKHTREAGVRQLEQRLGRLTRKIALQVAEQLDGNTLGTVVIEAGDLETWLGPSRIQPEEARKQLPVGVATGLAWTPTGGDVLYIEASLLPGSHDLTLTGQLGDVMQESARAARSYLWSHAEAMGVDISQFRRNGVHIHVPSGAIPKDGPSAGVTMTTALASAYHRVPMRSDTAMTGEISLSGLVLPVGGIKEKVLAAHRAGIRRVILPKANRKDLHEVPEEVRNQMELVFAEVIQDVLEAAFPAGMPAAPVSTAA